MRCSTRQRTCWIPQREAETEMTERHYAFVQNRECEYFPCHDGIPKEEFNCPFCYCPLYTLGTRCGGKPEFTETGMKSCIGCDFPHWREHYDAVNARFPELARLAAEQSRDHGV